MILRRQRREPEALPRRPEGNSESGVHLTSEPGFRRERQPKYRASRTLVSALNE